MRITFVLPGIGFSGGIRTVFECANRLIDHGHEVKIVYPLGLVRLKKHYGWRDWLEMIAIPIRRLLLGRQVKWFKLKAKLIRIPGLSKSLGYLVPEGEVVVATAVETAEFVNSLAANRGIKHYFVQHYEAWALWNNLALWKKISEQAGSPKEQSLQMARIGLNDNALAKYRAKINRTYHLPMRIFTTSTWLKALLENILGVKVAGRVDIGNDFEFFHSKQKIIKAGAMILMPFRGAAWRGDGDGVAALELVKREFPAVKITFFGSGLHRPGAPSWVDYQADLTDRELVELYSRADLFILPSWVEGWSSPPMEAMSCGTACICTDVGAVSDYAVNGKTVLIVPPHDPPALAEACLTLLRDDRKRMEIAQAGQEYIKKFTWDRTADQMEEIFKASLKNNNVQKNI